MLTVKDLQTYFYTRAGIVKAVDGVSFQLERGQTLGIVGESGSGKSVTMMSIMGLIPTPPGRIVGGSALFQGKDLLRMGAKELRHIRGRDIAMIFQDPMTSLNPYMRIERQMTEVLTEHFPQVTRHEARRKAIEMLEVVGIPEASARIDQFPHQFSGGMRQRVMIAMALMAEPKVLIADEPTTALDVTIQAQILSLLRDLQKERELSIILITHDLGVIAGLSDQVLVMYAGKPVEWAKTDALFYKHHHPYTDGLLRSLPTLDGDHGPLFSIPGLPPDPSRLPAGCAFAPRCGRAMAACYEARPIPLREISADHRSVCHQVVVPQ